MEKRIGTHMVFLATLIVSVSVSGQTIRLVSPLNNGVGRIEVIYNGTWGTVCDDGFGADEAKVVCKQLGRYKSGLTPRAIQRFGFGGGKIWLDDVSCSGTESSLASCSHRPWGAHNCLHSEDVGIICDPSDVTMKLTTSHNKGLLQVYHSWRWGTVCDDGFGQVEASVVCKALGYQGGKVIIVPASSNTMWLDDVQCTMRNTDLKDCKHRPWGSDDCSDSEAVGVQCFSFPEDSTAARLVSTTNTPGEGVLELYHGGQWGRVCYTGFGVEEATVVCRMLGHSTIGALASSYLNTGSSSRHVILDKVKCLGTELSLNECLHYPWGSGTCSSIVVRIQCPSANLQIRLNSTTRGRGRVEVLHNNVWGTVCRRSSFSSQEAQVVCKMANLPWTTASVTTSYGPGEGIIWLSNVDCTGTETSLDQCSHSGWGTAPSCSHSSDVGVVCRGATLNIHLEPTGSVLNVIIGQVVSVKCVVGYSSSRVTSFRWTHSGQSYSGQTFSKTITSKADSGSLTCSVQTVSASTRLNVLYPPVVHLEPRNDTLDIGVGEDLRVQCVVDDANPNVHTFQWSHNGQTSTGSTFLKRNISKSDQGELICTADNGHMMTPGRAATTIHVTSALVIHLEPQGSVLNVLLGQVISVVCVVDYSNSPVTSFRWTHNGHSYRGQAFSKTVTSKSDSGSLTCSVGNVHASTRINVLYPPVVHLEPRNDTLDIGVGEDLRVRCVVDDANPSFHTFQWSHNGQTTTGSTFLKRNISKSDQGELTCTADNGHMMTPGRAATTIHVTSALAIHLEPQGSVLNVLLGQVISVVCVVDYSNSPVTSFRWTHNGHPYSGQAFSKTVTSKSDSGSLTCSVGNVHASTRINVLYPPVVHLEPRNDTLDIGVGEDLRVRCVVDDANPSFHTFQWSHNGQTTTGSTFLKRNISKSDQGELTCTADNGHMMTPGRAATTIHVTSALVIHLEPQGSVLNVLLGQVISVVCVVDYSNSPVTSFRWTHNGHSYSGQAFSKTVTSKSDSGSLTCSVGNVHASTRINVWYPPVVHLEPRNDTLDIGVGEDLRVQCVVDDANPSVHTFQWSHNGQTSTGSTFLKRNISKSDQGELTCTADNGHMMTPGRAATTIHVTSALVIHLEPQGSVLNVLLGQVISVVCVVDYSNSPVTSFRWTHNGHSYSGQAFSKTVTSKSDSGSLTCSVGNVHASTRINVLYPPVVHLEPSNDTLDVGVGEDLSVHCVVDDANPGVYTFQWSHNGQSCNGSTFLKRNISKSDQGELICTADNGHMMTPGQAVATVNVRYPPKIHVEPNQQVIIVRQGGDVTVVCVVEDANPSVTSYKWFHNHNVSYGQAFMKHDLSTSDAGNLSCSATNGQGSSFVMIKIIVSHYVPPMVHLEPGNGTLDVGEGEDLRVHCVVDDPDPTVYTFWWSHNGQTSDGSTSSFLKRNISKSDQGQLVCTADNGHMMMPLWALTTINVKYPPEIHLSPRQDVISVMAGDAVEVECVVDDANPAVTSYMWCHNNYFSHGQTFMKHVSSSDAGNLSCSATNEQGTSTVQTTINVLQASSLIMSDNTTSHDEVIAIVTGSVGIVTIILLLIIIIHLRRRLQLPTNRKAKEKSKRSERASRLDAIPARPQTVYETMGPRSEGAENIYCQIQETAITDADPDDTYLNDAFEDEEDIDQNLVMRHRQRAEHLWTNGMPETDRNQQALAKPVFQDTTSRNQSTI